ncbi:hypothetical protein KO481_34910 [Nocardia sp. NEAU-G5]|uniref:Polymerase nucleotidyl transferase domain-containing protein n=1 Tax=Nocardia albiluteola TaxID=2842303 RepID=A0ABS6B8R4_9NOCA|nr:hypothetical protein [Nocardia albiluteola]MBU3066694.1 hypothetical protein [Nocardia albiluteola]
MLEEILRDDHDLAAILALGDYALGSTVFGSELPVFGTLDFGHAVPQAALEHIAFGQISRAGRRYSARADNADTLDSDIDLLVVLPNDVPVAQALQGRETFTRNYIHLHTLFERPPDLQWPGEVCDAADLDAGISGAAFDLDSGPELRLCSDGRPYRHWVSMGATGTPLVGRAALAGYTIQAERLQALQSAYQPRCTPVGLGPMGVGCRTV